LPQVREWFESHAESRLGNLTLAAELNPMIFPDIPEALFNADGTLGDTDALETTGDIKRKSRAKKSSTAKLVEQYRSAETILHYQAQIITAYRYIKDLYGAVKSERVNKKTVLWPKIPKDTFTAFLVRCCQTTAMPFLNRIGKSPRSVVQMISAFALHAHYFFELGTSFFNTEDWHVVHIMMQKYLPPGRKFLDNPRTDIYQVPHKFHRVLEPGVTVSMARTREAKLKKAETALTQWVSAFENIPHIHEIADNETVHTNPPDDTTPPALFIADLMVPLVAVSILSAHGLRYHVRISDAYAIYQGLRQMQIYNIEHSVRKFRRFNTDSVVAAPFYSRYIDMPVFKTPQLERARDWSTTPMSEGLREMFAQNAFPDHWATDQIPESHGEEDKSSSENDEESTASGSNPRRTRARRNDLMEPSAGPSDNADLSPRSERIPTLSHPRNSLAVGDDDDDMEGVQPALVDGVENGPEGDLARADDREPDGNDIPVRNAHEELLALEPRSISTHATNPVWYEGSADLDGDNNTEWIQKVVITKDGETVYEYDDDSRFIPVGSPNPGFTLQDAEQGASTI
jgi:hypothetical protein